jgi:hypothetical protein
MIFENRQRFANERFCIPLPRTRSMTKESRHIQELLKQSKVLNTVVNSQKYIKCPISFWRSAK